jgi:hypothetical protein
MTSKSYTTKVTSKYIGNVWNSLKMVVLNKLGITTIFFCLEADSNKTAHYEGVRYNKRVHVWGHKV